MASGSSLGRVRAEIREIESGDLRSTWDDKAQAFADAAKCAAKMEVSAPLVAEELAEADGAEAPTWTWSAGPESDESILKWTATICMAGATPYADGAFVLKIQIPEDYPFKPPTFQFVTSIHHPGVDASGKICLAELQLVSDGGTWDTSKKIHNILDLVGGMLAYPESILGHPLRDDLAGQLKSDKARFIKTAKRETEKHASG